MMHSNWLQGLLGRSRCEGVAWQFVKNQIKTGRVARETSEGKDKKSKAIKNADLKGPAITQLIMSIRRKYERRDMKGSKNRRVILLGGTQAICWFCLNIGKLEITGTFSLEELVNHLLVRGTISFYNQNCNFFLLEKAPLLNVTIGLNEQCWRGTISFSAVFH